jgi:hypothetical protein
MSIDPGSSAYDVLSPLLRMTGPESGRHPASPTSPSPKIAFVVRARPVGRIEVLPDFAVFVTGRGLVDRTKKFRSIPAEQVTKTVS